MVFLMAEAAAARPSYPFAYYPHLVTERQLLAQETQLQVPRLDLSLPEECGYELTLLPLCKRAGDMNELKVMKAEVE